MRTFIATILVLLPSLVFAGGVDTKPVQFELADAVLMALPVEGEGGVDTIFSQPKLRVSKLKMVAQNNCAVLVQVNNIEALFEIPKTELEKSESFFELVNQ